ncbi:L-threonylcarbamoyladenylate synthase [Rhodopirellula sallentina]|uniref:Threonylcarbamoyl-AMP synthase n=1 Tax=Rhodopirellula sallentina SM41 TaxID=1263870 RepID=M5U277_9BACT|nr:L-threonylcarbamoyladenylate synthase [Rhodopirellula sallentina]EMI55540.1 Translation factor, SUA5 type [Rhodopirellula sallentina SM41]
MSRSKSLFRSLICPPSSESIARAANAILEGKLIGMPTETVYGLAARGDMESAVDKIFAAKNRPRSNPLILHVADVEDAEHLFDIDASGIIAARLKRVHRFWPGPLTVVGPRDSQILDHVTAGGDTVAVRVPDHPVALELLRELKRLASRPIPVAAPSANRSNYISPTAPEHVAEGLGEEVAMVLDGGLCRVGLESTILFLGNASSSPRVLRSGGLSAEQLSEALGEPVGAPRQIQSSDSGDASPVAKESFVAAPGQFAKHYSPNTPVVLLSNDSGFAEQNSELPQNTTVPAPRVLRIVFGPLTREVSQGASEVWTLASDGRLERAAFELYGALRKADEGQFDRIEVVPCEETGIGIAIMDRLRRASQQE